MNGSKVIQSINRKIENYQTYFVYKSYSVPIPIDQDMGL